MIEPCKGGKETIAKSFKNDSPPMGLCNDIIISFLVIENSFCMSIDVWYLFTSWTLFWTGVLQGINNDAKSLLFFKVSNTSIVLVYFISMNKTHHRYSSKITFFHILNIS